MHEITLDGYAAQCAEQPIRLGTAGSYGVETLSVMRKGEWVDYDIIVAFHPPKGESVQIRLGSDNVVSVPAEATAVAGTGELTFAGYTDGVRQISVSQIYRVAVSAGTEGIAPAEPTPDVVQQILSAANEADSKAEQAQKVAQSVRDDADAGKFNGAQGPKGDTGPAVALDTTLTHEGEAADAKPQVTRSAQSRRGLPKYLKLTTQPSPPQAHGAVRTLWICFVHRWKKAATLLCVTLWRAIRLAWKRSGNPCRREVEHPAPKTFAPSRAGTA